MSVQFEGRLSRVEQRLEDTVILCEDSRESHRRKMDKIEEILEQNKLSLANIEKQLSNMKGFTAGIIFAVSAVFTIVTHFFNVKF